jgi:chromosome segregation ATPase
MTTINMSTTSSSTPTFSRASSTTSRTTLSIASTSGSIKLPCGPSYELLRQRFTHKNVQIKALEQENLNLELDKADLLLKTGTLKYQKQDLRANVTQLNEEIVRLNEEIAQLNDDVKMVAKQSAREFATKNKLHAQLKQMILTLRTLEADERKLEDENAELLLINATSQERNTNLVAMVRSTGGIQREAQKHLMRAAEKQMDLDHKVKSLEYELKFCRQAANIGVKEITGAVALRRIKKRSCLLGLHMRIAVKLSWSLGIFN